MIDPDGTHVGPKMHKKNLHYLQKLERINVMMAAMFATLPELQDMYYRGSSLVVWLQMFCKRAFDIDDKGIGSIHVWYWEGDNELGLEGRCWSGLRTEGGKCVVPYSETLVPFNARCVGPFMFPRILKDILRMGLNLDDIDMSISHMQCFAHRHKVADDTPIGQLVLNPDVLRAELVTSEYGQRVGAKAKMLPIKLLNGFESVPQGVPAWVQPLFDQIGTLLVKEQAEHAADLVKLKKRQHPTRTLTSRLNEHAERLVINRMEHRIQQKGLTVMAFEHDGLVGLGLAGLMPVFAREKIYLKNKRGPQTVAEWSAEHGMAVMLPEPSSDLIGRILDDPLTRGIMSLDSKYIDHHAFAQVIIRELARQYDFPTYVRERDNCENQAWIHKLLTVFKTLTNRFHIRCTHAQVVQCWDESRACWATAGGARKLRDEAPNILREVFQGAPIQPQDIGGLLGHHKFLTDVVDMTKSALPVQTDASIGLLDEAAARGKLRFDCGTLVDFKTKTVRRCHPSDRISLSTGKRFHSWSSSRRDVVEALASDLQELWTTEKDVEPGSDLEKRLDEEVSQKGVYWLFYCLFDNHNMALWLLRQMARGLAGMPVLEEFVFMYDPRGKNGKGTIMTLMFETLGSAGNNYYKTITYSVLKGSTDGGNDPRLDACCGKRVVSCNEAFKKKDAMMEFEPQVVKALISNDEPLETMGKYVSPRAWKGQALLVLSSNTMIDMPKEDGGLQSRLSLVKMPFTWVKDVLTPTDRLIDPTVKVEGVPKMVDEFVFWATLLNYGISQNPPKDRLLRPRPVEVECQSQTLFASGDDSIARRASLAVFVEKFCTQADEATTTTKGVQPTAAKDLLEAAQAHMNLHAAKEGYVVPVEFGEFLQQELVLMQSTRQKPFKVADKTVRSFYKVKDVKGKPFVTALRFNGF